MKEKRLTRRFYRRDPVTLARALLGHVLVRRLPEGQELAGRIVEVEAYLGVEDRACHSYGGRRTKRNAAMWLDGGYAYVYFVYGMHWCFNVVSDREEVPTACLIRALEPVAGLEEMRRLRGARQDRELCSGPAKLAQALAIDRRFDGVDLVEGKELFVRHGRRVADAKTDVGPRIGVSYAGEWAGRRLRVYESENPHVSRS